MDHRTIDQHAIAGRYLNDELTPVDRAQSTWSIALSAADRVRPAEMFQARNGRAAIVDVEAIRRAAMSAPQERTVTRRLPARWILWTALGIVLWLDLLSALFAWFFKGQ